MEADLAVFEPIPLHNKHPQMDIYEVLIITIIKESLNACKNFA